MLISIEGLDGVGKTTIVSNLSKALKIPNIEKPIKSLLELNPDHSKKLRKNYTLIIHLIFKQCIIYLVT